MILLPLAETLRAASQAQLKDKVSGRIAGLWWRITNALARSFKVNAELCSLHMAALPAKYND